jgi:hypothetical protein
VAFFVPLSVTVTWGIPLAVLSLTVPVTVIFGVGVCEKAGVMKKSKRPQENKSLPFLMSPGGRIPVSCRKCLV